MKSEFYKERIYPVLFMVIVTMVCIIPVAAVSLSTQDLVDRNEFLFLKQAILYAADIAFTDDPEKIDALFGTRIREERDASGEVRYYRVLSESGSDQGYVFRGAGPGLWGEIEAVIGFDETLAALTGLDFIKQNETPGLGARITEDWFREQFRGKQAPFVMVPEGQARQSNEVDAITGASRTSRFVLEIINGTAAGINQSIRGGE